MKKVWLSPRRCRESIRTEILAELLQAVDGGSDHACEEKRERLRMCVCVCAVLFLSTLPSIQSPSIHSEQGERLAASYVLQILDSTKQHNL